MTGTEGHYRGVKAAKLTLTCANLGIDATTLERLDNPGRAALCGLAQVHLASHDTWEIVLGALRSEHDNEAHGQPRLWSVQ